MKRAISAHATSSASHTLGTFPVQGKAFCAVQIWGNSYTDYYIELDRTSRRGGRVPLQRLNVPNNVGTNIIRPLQ